MFNVEDQVRLQPSLPISFGKCNFAKQGVTAEMQPFQSKVVTINGRIEVYDSQCPVIYEIKEDDGANWWTPQMIQGVVQRKQNPENITHIYVKADDGSIHRCKVLWTDEKGGVKHYVVDLNESFKLLKAPELATAEDIAKWKENEALLQQIEETKSVIAEATNMLQKLMEQAKVNGLM